MSDRQETAEEIVNSIEKTISLSEKKLNTQELHSGVGGLYSEPDLKASLKEVEKEAYIDLGKDLICISYKKFKQIFGAELI